MTKGAVQNLMPSSDLITTPNQHALGHHPTPLSRCAFLRKACFGGGALLVGGAREWGVAFAGQASPAKRPGPQWYDDAFFMLHLDHHFFEQHPAGAQADPAQTERLIALSAPDAIQMTAKGRPGWTTYPTKIGFTPARLARDVMAVWRDIARKRGCAWSVYYNLGRDGELMKRCPEWNRVDAKGKLREDALCYHSGVAEGYLWPMPGKSQEVISHSHTLLHRNTSEMGRSLRKNILGLA